MAIRGGGIHRKFDSAEKSAEYQKNLDVPTVYCHAHFSRLAMPVRHQMHRLSLCPAVLEWLSQAERPQK